MHTSIKLYSMIAIIKNFFKNNFSVSGSETQALRAMLTLN